MAKKILVVDDSAMMRKIIIKCLRDCGFDIEAVEAGNGRDGVDLFTKGGFDLVVSDWNMPVMNGLDMIKEIRKLDPEKKVPIFMVTTEVSAEKVKEALMAGASNYIGKPFTPERLKEKFEKFLSSK